MKIFFQSLFPALWILWLLYRAVLAIGAKRVERRESIGSHEVYARCRTEVAALIPFVVQPI